MHKLAVESTRGIGIDAIWVSRLTLKRVWSLDTTRAGVPLWLRSGHQHSQSLAAFLLGCTLTCAGSSLKVHLDSMFLSPSARLCRTRWLSIHLGRLSRTPLLRQNYTALLHSSSVTSSEADPAGELSPQLTQQAHSGVLCSNRLHCHPHGFPTAPFPRRTHTCGALSPSDADKTVVLTGWLIPKGYVHHPHSLLCQVLDRPWARRKVSKKLSFFGLRDSCGTTQLVADARTLGPELLASIRDIPEESTVLVEGVVRERPSSQQRDVGAIS